MDKDEHKREIHNLFDVIEKVKKLEKQERKHRQYSDEKDRDDATQIKDEVNEVEYDDINGIFQSYPRILGRATGEWHGPWSRLRGDGH